jgi:hypothetical protein
MSNVVIHSTKTLETNFRNIHSRLMRLNILWKKYIDVSKLHAIKFEQLVLFYWFPCKKKRLFPPGNY